MTEQSSPIEIGATYEFHSTSTTDETVTPFSGQTVTVLGTIEVEDPEVEPLYEVRFPDGHTAQAYEGELNGYYLRTDQCVEAWRRDPKLAAQMERDAAQWA